jgi:hypothetical protein
MKKSIINKLYWSFWCSTTVFTGISAGMMIAHILQLGRFFTWLIESGNEDLLHQTFTIFRQTNRIQDMSYDSLLYLALVSGIIWVVLAFILKRERVIAIIAGLSTVWVGAIFSISDIDEAEEAVLSGTADARLTQLFASINVPVHTCFAVIYTVCFILLLYVALKRIKAND